MITLKSPVVISVVISYHTRKIWYNIRRLYMREFDTLAHNATIKLHKGVQYPCRLCNHQATSKRGLAQQKRAVHERVEYSFRQCHCQATSKGSLARHKRSVHEGVKYPCRHCGKQFSLEGHLDENQSAVHEGVKYPCRHFDHQATTKGKSCSPQKSST